ncbi:MAG: hypothetical protein KA715_08755 [Xanthomonadaceae bacterium]|nr:hypothetical protein [Xanthomonadaceae bacterium]
MFFIQILIQFWTAAAIDQCCFKLSRSIGIEWEFMPLKFDNKKIISPKIFY